MSKYVFTDGAGLERAYDGVREYVALGRGGFQNKPHLRQRGGVWFCTGRGIGCSGATPAAAHGHWVRSPWVPSRLWMR